MRAIGNNFFLTEGTKIMSVVLGGQCFALEIHPNLIYEMEEENIYSHSFEGF